MQQVAEFSLSLLEANAVALLRIVMGIERMALQPRRPRLRLPNGGCRTIAEQTRADDDTRIVVEIERCGTNLHG